MQPCAAKRRRRGKQNFPLTHETMTGLVKTGQEITLSKAWIETQVTSAKVDKGQKWFGLFVLFQAIPHSNHIQFLQKVFTPLDFCHVLLCYSLNLKWMKLNLFFCHQCTQNDKVKTGF